MLKKTFLIICYLLFIAQTFAQNVLSEKDYELQYKKAVQLYANQAYEEARAALFPLTHRRNSNTYVPYTLYYYALSSIKANKTFEARLMLRQLFERFPDWQKSEEAYYLFANASFPDAYFDEGINYLQKIENPAMKEDKINLLYHYVAKIDDLERIKKLQKLYPNETGIALALVEKIQSSSNVSNADLALSDNLINRFGLGKKISSTTKIQTKNPNDTRVLNMGFLLPFKLNEFSEEEKKRTNQYVYEFYDGAKFAKNKLQSEGININLQAFDIEKSGEQMLDLVNNEQLDQTDILIGPLYAESNKVAATFATDKGIILVNPLSNNSQLIAEQANVFLAQASYEQQVNKTIDLLRTISRPKSANIYFGSSRKDSTLAYIYKNSLENQGYRVLEFKKLGNPELVLQSGNVGHIFVVASEGNLAGKIMAQLDKKKLNVPLICTSGAFDFENISGTLFSNRTVYVLYPEYVDKQKREVQIFKEQYFQKRNTIASYHAMLGYDMALFYGRILSKYGKNDFRTGLNAMPDNNGLLLSGFDYSNAAYENQIVPIVKYKDGGMELIK